MRGFIGLRQETQPLCGANALVRSRPPGRLEFSENSAVLAELPWCGAFRAAGLRTISPRYALFAISQMCDTMGTALPSGGWRILKYASDSQRDVIDEWLNGLPIGERKKVRMELETLLRLLRQTKAALWSRPQFAWLSGDNCAGVGEIVFDCRGVPYRVLGCFGAAEGCFTLLVGARKDRKRKGKVQWDPRNAVETAIKRKATLPGRALLEYEL
jgi:hypothetical protein